MILNGVTALKKKQQKTISGGLRECRDNGDCITAGNPLDTWTCASGFCHVG
ncbi:hypothetical protein [Aquimarina spinulae]|uniref:hypothetical protein n=1 Tax=Aquimarina spinulae TaxID=1192023 RepID=UPI00131F4210|nr:hypothetical protein [Aquimarina spinulae]